MDKELLLSYLKSKHKGQQNAVSSAVLEDKYQVSGRAIRDAVSRLRCAGQPVCSGDEGYYYAANSRELSQTIRQLSSRITKLAVVKNGLVRATKQFTDNGQLSFPLQ